MTSKLYLPMIVLTVLVNFPASLALAQFDRLFRRANVPIIETADLARMLQQQQQAEIDARNTGTEPPQAEFVLVDVRTAAEVNVSVIPGAITKSQYEQHRQQYQGRLVIPYCTVGGRSGAYARELAKAGVKVKNYQGSILKWVGAGLPVVTLDGQPTNRVHTYSDRYRIPAQYEQVTE